MDGNTYALNKYMADCEAQEALEEHLDVQATMIAFDLKTPAGFSVGSVNHNFDDVLIDDEQLAEKLRECLSIGSFHSMDEYLQEAVYKYALELATEIYNEVL